MDVRRVCAACRVDQGEPRLVRLVGGALVGTRGLELAGAAPRGLIVQATGVRLCTQDIKVVWLTSSLGVSESFGVNLWAKGSWPWLPLPP